MTSFVERRILPPCQPLPYLSRPCFLFQDAPGGVLASYTPKGAPSETCSIRFTSPPASLLPHYHYSMGLCTKDDPLPRRRLDQFIPLRDLRFCVFAFLAGSDAHDALFLEDSFQNTCECAILADVASPLEARIYAVGMP